MQPVGTIPGPPTERLFEEHVIDGVLRHPRCHAVTGELLVVVTPVGGRPVHHMLLVLCVLRSCNGMVLLNIGLSLGDDVDSEARKIAIYLRKWAARGGATSATVLVDNASAEHVTALQARLTGYHVRATRSLSRGFATLRLLRDAMDTMSIGSCVQVEWFVGRMYAVELAYRCDQWAVSGDAVVLDLIALLLHAICWRPDTVHES